MFKKIVVGVDGSGGATHAMDYAVDIAKDEGAQLVLAHVEEVTVGRGVAPVHSGEQVEEEIGHKADALRSTGIDVELETASTIVGGPAAVISKIADTRDADLIVVGTRGHSAAAGVVLGSVSQRLLHLASQPVLVVPESAQPSNGASAS